MSCCVTVESQRLFGYLTYNSQSLYLLHRDQMMSMSKRAKICLVRVLQTWITTQGKQTNFIPCRNTVQHKNPINSECQCLKTFCAAIFLHCRMMEYDLRISRFDKTETQRYLHNWCHSLQIAMNDFCSVESQFQTFRPSAFVPLSYHVQ